MNNRIIAIIVIVLGAFAAYLYMKDGRGTIKPELRNFAVEDTAAITKIFLGDKAQKTVTLTRLSTGRWRINDTYYVRKDLIAVLLKTIKTLEVKMPVAKAARGNVIKRLASGATKVEIYQGEDTPMKVYYVGGATQNSMGTYMAIEGSSEPFITHVPSFFGYLSSRYVTNVDLWRDRTFIDLQFKDIQRMGIEFPGDPKFSFSIENKGNWKFELKSLANDSIVPDYDTTALLVYLTKFKNVQYEGYEKEMNQHFIDSIFNAQPTYIFTVETTDGQISKMETFLKPDMEGRLDNDGVPILFDVDRLYARINGRPELLTVQYYVFDNIILGLQDFLKEQDPSDI